jgi:anti-sigma factor RsiW
MSDHLTDEQLSRLIDGDLPPIARTAAMTHLHGCTACALRHDTLVEAVAGLRTAEPFVWTPRSEDGALERIRARPARRRVDVGSLSFVAMVIVSLIAIALVVPPLLRTGLGVARVALAPVAWLAPGGAGPGRALFALVAVAFIGPLLAYPLMRWR